MLTFSNLYSSCIFRKISKNIMENNGVRHILYFIRNDTLINMLICIPLNITAMSNVDIQQKRMLIPSTSPIILRTYCKSSTFGMYWSLESWNLMFVIKSIKSHFTAAVISAVDVNDCALFEFARTVRNCKDCFLLSVRPDTLLRLYCCSCFQSRFHCSCLRTFQMLFLGQYHHG